MGKRGLPIGQKKKKSTQTNKQTWDGSSVACERGKDLWVSSHNRASSRKLNGHRPKDFAGEGRRKKKKVSNERVGGKGGKHAGIGHHTFCKGLSQ